MKPAFKLWLEKKGKYAFGQGTFELLRKIQELGSLSAAARALEISYRHAWGIIKKAEERCGGLLLKTRRGGQHGGGAELTETGQELVGQFLRTKKAFSSVSEDDLKWEELFVKISARNLIRGQVVSVRKGDVAATVKIRVNVPCVVTSIITREAVDDLDIKKGDAVAAVVKATEVMVSKEPERKESL